MNAVAVASVQGLPYTNVPTATPSGGIPWYCKSCCVNGANCVSNMTIGPLLLQKMLEIIQKYRASSVARGQRYLPHQWQTIKHKLFKTKCYLKQDYQSHLTIENNLKVEKR